MCSVKSYVPGGDANPAARADFHCPSFLRSYVDKSGNTHGRGLLQFAKPRKLHGSAVIRINLHIIGRLEKHTEFRCEAVEIRSEERSVGKECVSTCRDRCRPNH